LERRLWLAMTRERVMQIRRPSGMLLMMTPIPKIRHSDAESCITKRAMKKQMTLRQIVMIAMMKVNLSIYDFRGVRSVYYSDANDTICPRMVFYETRITIPRHWPSRQRVPKKARFLL
jgi:hypothetical protein